MSTELLLEVQPEDVEAEWETHFDLAPDDLGSFARGVWMTRCATDAFRTFPVGRTTEENFFRFLLEHSEVVAWSYLGYMLIDMGWAVYNSDTMFQVYDSGKVWSK